MIKKINQIKLWIRAHKENLLEEAKGYYIGYSLGCSVVFTLMILKALITHKKWDLVDPKKKKTEYCKG